MTTDSRPPQPSWAGTGIALGLAGVLVLLAIVFALVGRSVRGESEASRTWPSINAVVTQSEMVSHQDRDPRTGTARTWRGAQLTYEFTVGGRVYQGSRLSASVTNSVTEADLARYPVGRRMDIVYDPADPRRSAVHAGDGSGDIGFTILTGVLGTLAAAFVGLAVRLRPR